LFKYSCASKFPATRRSAHSSRVKFLRKGTTSASWSLQVAVAPWRNKLTLYGVWSRVCTAFKFPDGKRPWEERLSSLSSRVASAETVSR
jgi:hypothetical protein